MIDLIVGNDVEVPDMFYLGQEYSADLNLIQNQDKIVPFTSLFTMSIETADFNNDLHFDMFFSDMLMESSQAGHYCNNIKTNPVESWIWLWC